MSLQFWKFYKENDCHCRTIWKTINLDCAETIDMYALKKF